jgi:hypothetical protein
MLSVLKALKPKHWRELYRHFRNFNYEYDDDNNDLLISHARIGGVYEIDAPDGLGITVAHNLLTTEGCNALLSCGVAGGTQYGTWYIAPFSGNVTVLDTWTAATFAATATEITAYAEGNRVAFVESVPASKSANNTANPAVFTAATTNVSIWGVGLLSSATKSSTAGVLLSAAKYSTVRSLPTAGDQLSVKYTITLANG